MYMHANYLHFSKLTAVFEVSLAIKLPWILIRERERERESVERIQRKRKREACVEKREKGKSWEVEAHSWVF